MIARRLALVAIAASALACTAQVPTDAPTVRKSPAASANDTGTPPHDDTAPPPPADAALDDVSAAHAIAYLNAVLPSLAGRSLTAAERAQLESERGHAILPILSAAVTEPGFARSARTLVERKLSVSGTKDGVDFGLPGNLAEVVAKQQRPWSEILTAGSCYDAAGAPIVCDTGAPYTAGVLTTRGYLIARAGRFNLTRSSTLMRAFACTGYPMDDLEPKLPKDKLIPMFRAESIEEAAGADERAAGGFGNGEGCYFCHGQFSAHAQLYVKFDLNGLYRADATGLQDPAGELGRSVDGLMASHMFNPDDAKSERSQMFGEPVQNLADAARVFTQNPVFVTCAARNVLEHALLVDPSVNVDILLLRRIADAAKARHADPTLQDIVIAALTDPTVVESALQTLTGGAP